MESEPRSTGNKKHVDNKFTDSRTINLSEDSEEILLNIKASGDVGDDDSEKFVFTG